MNNPHLAIKTLALAVIAAGTVDAVAEIPTAFVPYINMGMADYTLEFDGDLPSPEAEGVLIDRNSKYFLQPSTVKVGLAATLKSFYINSYYRGNGEDSAIHVQELPENTGLPPISLKWIGDRDEWSITGGYNMDESFSVFAGYRDSEARAKGTGSSFYNFGNDGWFIGAGYRLPLSTTGGLTFSLGYAWLDAEIDQGFLGTRYKSDGNGSGTKLGASWRDYLSGNWGYTISVEHYNYDFELDKLSAAGRDTDMSEIETAFTLGLFYVFH